MGSKQHKSNWPTIDNQAMKTSIKKMGEDLDKAEEAIQHFISNYTQCMKQPLIEIDSLLTKMEDNYPYTESDIHTIELTIGQMEIMLTRMVTELKESRPKKSL
jgi:hypothetical protein